MLASKKGPTSLANNKSGKIMAFLKIGRHAAPATVKQGKSVTIIDRELQDVIVQLNRVPRANIARRSALLSQLEELKSIRKKAVQPKSYKRMLASLG